ncbi:uncharacterized protein [Diadema antillarum]|uniref:uncharacterized protein isoform X2 n=1 Tax=Diadema antillarum TaxID=105358 RepID=UPI003A8B870E
MSVAVQVVNGREQGTEEDEAAASAASQPQETMEDAPASPKEDVMSDGDEQAGAPKKKKFKPWKSIRKMFKRKKSSKGSEEEGDPAAVSSKTMSKSTGELAMGGDTEGELDKRISMSEDSVFSPDKPAPTREEVRNSFALDSSNLADEISAKLKERANSTDDGYAQSSEDAMTTGDITQDNSDVAPSDSSKTDSGIITTEEEKSFSAGFKEKQHATADMKRLNAENPGDIDLDLIQGRSLLSSSAAKHRISVAPSNRKPSRKARTPQRRSSSRLDDGPTPIEEEPTSPTKSPTPLILDNGDEKTDTSKEVQEAEVPVVFIDTSLPEQQEKSLADDTPASPGSKKEEGQVEVEEEEREQQMMRLPEPKEVIIIMKDAGTKKEPEKEEEKEKEEVKEEEESTPEPQPVETDAPQESSTREDDEKENVEMEKEDEEIMTREPTKEEIVEERRLSVAASKALFEARIPEPDPVKTNNRVKVNGFSHRANNIRPVGEEQTPAAETKAEADTKVTEKEKAEEEKEEKIAPVIEMDKEEEEEKNEEEEKLVSLKDRISRYQSLASKTKGITSHVPTRTSPSKQRPASTSNIENKDRKFGPKVPSKPSSTSSSKPSSTATTTDTSKPSTNPSSSSSSTSTPSSSTTTPPVSSTTPSAPSPSRKPLTPKIDRCLVCQKAVYQNEMSKLEGHVFHRRCQKCSECQRTLTLWNVDITGDKLYCKQHGSVVKNKQLQERLVAV